MQLHNIRFSPLACVPNLDNWFVDDRRRGIAFANDAAGNWSNDSRLDSLEFIVDQGLPQYFPDHFSDALAMAVSALGSEACAKHFRKGVGIWSDLAKVLGELVKRGGQAPGELRVVLRALSAGQSVYAPTGGRGGIVAYLERPDPDLPGLPGLPSTTLTATYNFVQISNSQSEWRNGGTPSSIRFNAQTLIHELGHFFNMSFLPPGLTGSLTAQTQISFLTERWTAIAYPTRTDFPSALERS